MWIMLKDSFLSIVRDKEAVTDTLLVRARKRADILAVFPGAKVRSTPKRDYQFRADVTRAEVAKALVDQVFAIDYDNFKHTVEDPARHAAYARIWTTMFDWASPPPVYQTSWSREQAGLPWWDRSPPPEETPKGRPRKPRKAAREPRRIVVSQEPWSACAPAWSAYDEDYGGPPEHVGVGNTADEAVQDLLQWLDLDPDVPVQVIAEDGCTIISWGGK